MIWIQKCMSGKKMGKFTDGRVDTWVGEEMEMLLLTSTA